MTSYNVMHFEQHLSRYGLSAIPWNNSELILIKPLGTHFNRDWIQIHMIFFEQLHSKMPSAIRLPFNARIRAQQWWLMGELCLYMCRLQTMEHPCIGTLVLHVTSWQFNAFRITGLLLGKSTDHRRIPLTKGQYCRANGTNNQVTADLRRYKSYVASL